jgi:Na+-transporting NADH:ubiquinone oxidoreductase subunit NqrA
VTQHQDLLKRINGASRDEVLEAARYFADHVAGGSADLKTAKALAQGLAKNPFAQVPALEELSRALLVAGANNPPLSAAVEDALDGAARKHFVLGGLEIVALACLAVTALRVVVAKGVGEEKHKESITIRPDGTVVVVVDKSKKAITITEDLAAIFRGLVGTKPH